MEIEAEVATPVDRAIWFGPFCLRPAAHLLLEADTPVHIGNRALDLLIVLVGRAGDIVTKDKFTWFELDLDYNISEAGNSGIMYHVTDAGKHAIGVEP